MDEKKIAGSNIHYRFYPFWECLDRLECLGIRKLDLFGATPHVWIDACSASDGRKLRAQMEAHGMEINTFIPEFSSMRYTLGSEGESSEKTWEYIRRCFEFADRLGTDRLVIGANGFLLGGEESFRWERFRTALHRLCGLAEQNGKDIFLINHFADRTDMVRTMEDMQRCMEMASGFKRLYPAVDTASVYEAGERLNDWFSCFGEKIAYVNLSSTKFDGTRRYWGDGYLNLAEIVNVLEENRFDGVLGAGYMVREYLAAPWEADRSSWNMFSWVCGRQNSDLKTPEAGQKPGIGGEERGRRGDREN